MRLSIDEMLSDERVMTDYICECIPSEYRVILAAGEDGVTWADLSAFWDDATGEHLLMEKSDEYVTLEEVYDHFRRREMTHAEWWRDFEWRAFRYKLLTPEGERPDGECRYLTAHDIVEHYQGKISLRLAYQIMDKCQPVRAEKKRLVTAESFRAYLRATRNEPPPQLPEPPQPRPAAMTRKRGQLPADGFEFFRFPH